MKKKPNISKPLQKMLALRRKFEIKEMEAEGLKDTEIAWYFNVSKVRINQIKKAKFN